MTANLNPEEQRVLRTIAAWFHEGKVDIARESALAELQLSDSQYNRIMLLMEHIGAIKAMHGLEHEPNYVALDFIPQPESQQLVRQMDAARAAAPDIITTLKNQIRQNPWTAWPLIAFFVLALLVPLINQLWELISKIINVFR